MIDSSFNRDKPFLKVLRAHSANPFDDRCPGAELTCLIRFHFINSSNSLLTKFVPLSEINTLGIPNCANITLNFWTVAVVVCS